jgi:hypothetical protein
MRYILEAHPSHDSNTEDGLYFLGNESEVTSTLRLLLAGTLGALAAKAPRVSPGLADFALRNLSRGAAPNTSVPKYHVAGIVEVLGVNNEEYLSTRGDQLIAGAVAGHLTMDQLVQEKKELRIFAVTEPPIWLTHDGLHADYSDGRLTPRVYPLERDTMSFNDYERSVAQEVGADSYTLQVAVAGNLPDSEGVTMLTDELIAFGRMSENGSFEHLVTVLHGSGE